MSDIAAVATERYRLIAASGEQSLENWCYKEVTHTWLGVTCRFGLSHAAFSSDRIDDGSKLLLDAIASRIEARKRWAGCTVYDIGCGVGVLGIAAAASLGAARLILEDRDSFSVALSCLNAWKNRLAADVIPNPAPTGVRSFAPAGLVLCNLPAKAGGEVHRMMLEHAVSHLSTDGMAGVVVVHPLAAAVEKVLTGLSLHVERRDSSGHAVFILRHSEAGVHQNGGESRHKASDAPNEVAARPLPHVYIGTTARFQLSKTSYSLTPVEGLPEFDGPSYMTRMLIKLGLDYGTNRPVLAVDNGPGHLAAVLSRRSSAVCCASRSALAAYAHEQLVFAAKRNKERHVVLTERPGLLAPYVPEQGLLVLPVVPDAYTPVFDELLELFEQVRARGSQCIVAGNSSTISRLEKLKIPLSIRRRAKSRGVRGLILEPS